MAKRKMEEMEGDLAVMELPESEPSKDCEPESPRLCIGLPVQYHTPTETLPALLQRQGLTDKSVWNVKVFLGGASVPVMRTAVKFSETPKAGCFSLLPR